MLETQLVNSILAQARYSDKVTLWRQNVGAAMMKNKDGKERYVRFGTAGISDIIGMRKSDGKFIALECKVGRNKLSVPQRAFGDMVLENNGIFDVIYTIDDWHKLIF